MKSLPIIGAAVAVFASIVLLSGVLSAQSVDRATVPEEVTGQGSTLLGPQSGDSDLNDCQQDCRSRFGYDMYANPQWRRGGGQTGTYYAYAACISECNRKFWKSFDKEMDNLGRD